MRRPELLLESLSRLRKSWAQGAGGLASQAIETLAWSGVGWLAPQHVAGFSSKASLEARERRRRRRQQQAAATLGTGPSHRRPTQQQQQQQQRWGRAAVAPPVGRVPPVVPLSASQAAAAEDEGAASGAPAWLQRMVNEARARLGHTLEADGDTPQHPQQQQQQQQQEEDSVPSEPRPGAVAEALAALDRVTALPEAAGPLSVDAVARYTLRDYLSYSRAARHGAPTVLDAGASHVGARGREARRMLLGRERSLRALAAALSRQAAGSDGSTRSSSAAGGGSGWVLDSADASALAGVSEAQIAAAASEARVPPSEVENAVVQFFSLRRAAELLSLQRAERAAIASALQRGAMNESEAAAALADAAARSAHGGDSSSGSGGSPLDPFFDMGAAGFLEFLRSQAAELGGGGGDRTSSAAGLDALDSEDDSEATAEEMARTVTLTGLRAATAVFAALPPGAARRPLGLGHSGVRAVAAMTGFSTGDVLGVLRQFASMKRGAVEGALAQLEAAAAEAAEAAGGVPRRRATLLRESDEERGEGAERRGGGSDGSSIWGQQEEGVDSEAAYRQWCAEMGGIANMSLAEFEARMEEQLRTAEATAPPTGRARAPSAAARGRSEARRLRGGLAALRALPGRARTALERRPDRGVSDQHLAEAAAAARVPAELLASVIDGYAALRSSAAEVLAAAEAATAPPQEEQQQQQQRWSGGPRAVWRW